MFRAWWPLAASWGLMGAELPLLSAVVARLDHPEVQLAAYGGVVFPIALLVEAPIIMLLTVSTSLAKDQAAYAALGRFTHRISAVLTLLHLALAFTPLYDLVVVRLLDVPDPVIEPARLGLRIMLLWTWAIAARRFQQGVLIRFGRSHLVSIGTAVRLVACVSALAIGYSLRAPGIVVATSAVIAGVLAESVFAAWHVRPVVRDVMMPGDPAAVLRGAGFLRFYVPLALAPLVTLITQPIGSAAISRMAWPLESLAVWPVTMGLFFLLQGAGLAFSEVTVALLERPGAAVALRRFAWLLTSVIAGVVVVLAVTPLADLWFGTLMGLRPELVALAHAALWLGLPVAAARSLQSWFQGVLVHARKTRAISESVVLFLVVCTTLLVLGVHYSTSAGLLVAFFCFAWGRLAETAWMAWRSRPLRRELGV